MKTTKLKGNLILLLTAFIWGVSFIAQSKGVEEIPPITFNGIRSLLGGAVLIPVILFSDRQKRKRNIPICKADKKTIINGILCGIFLFLASTLQTVGMVHTGPGKAGFITALYIVIIPILRFFGGVKTRPLILISVLIAVAGLYFMCIDSEISIQSSDIVIFLSAFLFAGHILLIDKISPSADGIKLSCIQFLACGSISLICVLIFENPQLEPILNSGMTIFYSGVVSCGIGYTIQIIGQKYTDPTSASIIMSLESVFSVLATVILSAFGWSLTGGQLEPREIIGCVLMFISTMLVQLPEKR